MKKKSKIQLIKEVAKKYNLNNRSLNSKLDCVYTGKNNTHCAVGNYLKEKYQTTKFKFNAKCLNTMMVEKSEKGGLDFYLREEVQGYELRFWEDLQFFHDHEANWTEEGLSSEGERFRDSLLNKYKKKSKKDLEI